MRLTESGATTVELKAGIRPELLWHVAVLVRVATPQGIVPMVLDPAMGEHPLALSEWQKRFSTLPGQDEVMFATSVPYALGLDEITSDYRSWQDGHWETVAQRLREAASYAESSRPEREADRREDQLYRDNELFRRALQNGSFRRWWLRNRQDPQSMTSWPQHLPQHLRGIALAPVP